MKPIVAGVLATITALSLLPACGSDAKLTLPADSTSSISFTIPEEVTIPAGATIPTGAIPSDATIPQAAIDQMITQFEQAGMKVDKACFTALLKDESLRKMVEAGGTPNQGAIQKFLTCLSA